MKPFDPTDESKSGTAPDGKINIDHARCRELLTNEIGGRLSLFAVFAILYLLLSPLAALLVYGAAQTGAFLRVLFIVLAAVFLLTALYFWICFLRQLVFFLWARRGIFRVERDEVARVTVRLSFSLIFYPYSRLFYRKRLRYSFWRRYYFTVVRFRRGGKIWFPGDVPPENINTRDIFYIVRAGKSARSRRVDLFFDTRKYQFEDERKDQTP